MITICRNPGCGRGYKVRSDEDSGSICPACARAEARTASPGKASPSLSAYLDIETTGLSPYSSDITVVGIFLRSRDKESKIIQLVGEDISPETVISALAEVRTVYTYNGSRFDLKYIHAKLGVDIARLCAHEDLMYRCWKHNLYGGLKSVEKQLGIRRKLEGLGGEDAVRLWYDHLAGDRDALRILLEYNREDIVNLPVLRDRLQNG